jgi:enterochelin esterase-like enzyme
VNYARPPYDPFIIASKDGEIPTRIFLSAGKNEPSFRKAIEEFSATLEEYGFQHTYLHTEGGHDTEGWILVFDDMLIFLSELWPN